MIITTDDIKKVRPIANNINDLKRIEPYIKEAEILDVLPVLGASLYKQLDGFSGTSITNNEGVMIEITSELKEVLFDGGYYDCSNCNCSDSMRYSQGLIAAISYLSYARFLPANQINVTAFSAVVKRGEFSDPADERSIVRASKDAEKIGHEYLRQCIDFMQCKNIIYTCNPINTRNRKFKKIGD